jgi:uncharacterized protein DUF955
MFGVVQPKPETVDGVSGMLLWRGTRFGILYATHIDNEGFQRFCVSHELGHYLLPGHLDHLSRADNGWPASRAGFVSTDPYELEADYFATALLMPEPWFSQACQGATPGLATVQRLAGLCRTSLTATAMRYVHTTTAPVALVMSSGATIDYCFLSRALQQVAGLRRPPRRSALPLASATRQLNDYPRHVALALARTAEVDLRLWFGGCQARPGLEEAIGLGRYGKTLTLLSVVDGAPDAGSACP